MQGQQQRPTSILAIISQAFARASTGQQFATIRGNMNMNLVVVERVDKHMAYVTDGLNTILAISQEKRQQIMFHPLNRQNTPHYTFQSKSYMYLNFTTITDCPPSYAIHPYSPHFYFKERYGEYMTIRETLELKKPCEKLKILKWRWGLVNISMTGYYAPVIVTEDLQKLFAPNQPILKDLNCILFQPSVQENLEAYRLFDMRKKLQPKVPQNQHISLFYYLRHLKISNTQLKGSSLVVIDQEQKILKNEIDKENKAFVIVGNLKGVCSFINPIQRELNRQRIEQINVEEMTMLFNGLAINQKQIANKEESKKHSIELWSDSDSSKSESESHSSPMKMDNESDSDNADDDDPLRNLYLKMISKN